MFNIMLFTIFRLFRNMSCFIDNTEVFNPLLSTLGQNKLNLIFPAANQFLIHDVVAQIDGFDSFLLCKRCILSLCCYNFEWSLWAVDGNFVN